MEIWKAIPGFEGIYEASNTGDIRRIGKNKGARAGLIIRPYKTTHGYLAVKLCKDRKTKYYAVHRAVLEAFTEKKPRNIDVRHKDGCRTNNVLDNLCWGTRSENMQDAAMHGRTNRGRKNFSNKLSEQDVIEIFHSKTNQRLIGEKYGVGQDVVSRIKNRKAWTWLTNAIESE